MTYNEWRDELKSNLLCVSEGERRRVLDYYAEAYADRRDAGFTEREIIDDFGAPYDAAQRILSERGEVEYFEAPNAEYEQPAQNTQNIQNARPTRDEKRAQRTPPPPPQQPQPQYNNNQQYGGQQYCAPQPVQQTAKKRDDLTWVFVLLCVIFAVPLFCVVMTMVGVTVGFCVAPFAVIISGVATIGQGFGMLFSEAASGVCYIGLGLVIFGVGVALVPLFIKLVGLMWKLFNMFFKWLKTMFSGKEARV